MKKLKQVSIAVLLFVSLLTVMVGLGINAFSDTTPGGLHYEATDEKVIITDCDESATEIVIPEMIDDLPVTEIAEGAFDGCTALADVYYGGDKAEWEAIGFAFSQDIRIHFECTDSEDHYTSETTDPTCTEDGYTTYTCDCEYSYTIEGDEALGHNNIVIAASEPTCTEDGNTEGAYCIRCKESTIEPEIISAPGHTWTDANCTTAKTCSVCTETEGEALGHTDTTREEDLIDATCSEDGSFTLVTYCSVCDEILGTEEKTIPATNAHIYETETERKESTCSTAGYVIMACVCGAEEKTVFEELDVNNHEDVQNTDKKNPTCTEPGKTEGSYCSVCSKMIEVPQSIPALGHDWSEATCAAPKTCKVCNETEGEALSHTWTDANCTTAKTCSVCNETEGEALGHTNTTREENRTEASCSEDGSYDLVTYCSVCDEVLGTETKTIPATGEHSFTIETERVASTCTTAGYVIMACGCGETEKTDFEELDADNHENIVVINAVAPSCSETGLTEGRYCSACNAVIASQEEISALGHTWAEATCTAPKTCTVCQSTEGDVLEHTWKDATCTEAKTCTVCNATEGNPNGHKFTNYVLNNDATCTEDGTKTAKCDNCNAKTTIAVTGTALGHDIVIDEAVAATCTTTGLAEGSHCTRCDEMTVPQEEIPMTAHDWVESADSRTCNACGLTEWKSLQLIITADKNTAEPSDTITYTVALTPVQNLAGIEFQLVIPENLKFIDGALADGLQQTLNAAACNFNKDAYKVVIGGGMDYTSSGLTTILTFTCAVDRNFTGELVMGVDTDTWYFETSASEILDIVLNNKDSKVTVSCSHKSYAEIADEKYLQSEADCYSPAVYFKSCTFCHAAIETETFEYGKALGHDWAAATCNASSTCKVCNATTGAPLGHNFVNYISDNNATCTVDGTKTAKCERCDTKDTVSDEGTAGHKWIAASCTEPEMCKICKETKGEANGHSWTDATCTDAKTCTVCKATESEALGHDWQEATDVLPELCARCGIAKNVKVQLIITADKDTAKIGDTITYTVSLGPVYKIAGIEFMLDIPEGLTFRSGELVPGLQQTLNAAACNFNADRLKLVIGGGMAYTNAEITPVLTFTCKVNNGFVGDILMSVDTDSLYIEDIFSEVEIEIVNEGSKVNVPCAHPGTTIHEAVASTCKTPGHAEYSTCNRCGIIVNGSDAPLELDPENHSDVTIHDAVQGTCLRPGHDEYSVCNECGILVSGSTEDVIHPHGNRRLEDEKYIKTPATCTTTPVYYMHCEHCGEANVTATFTAGSALGHDIISIPAVAPTCTETGLTEGTRCSRCDEIKTGLEVIAATGHTWTPATCTESKTCSACNLTEGEALGHTWADATCTTAMTCTVCNATAGEALGHTWTEATCTTAKTCSVCRITEGTALGHNLIIVPGFNPTCTESGLTDGSYCSRCDVKTDRDIIPATGHTAITVPGFAATCTEEGLSDGAKCLVCDITIKVQEVVPATGHTEINVPGFAATCTETGLTDGSKCSVCNIVFKAQDIILATGHTVVTVTGKSETCTEAGLTDGSECSVCKNVIKAQEVIPATGHTEVAVAGKNATCTEDGLTDGSKCSACDTVFKAQEVIPATGHTEITVPGKAATCTDAGFTDGAFCSVCDTMIKNQDIIPATGHTEVTVTGKAATCTESGLTDGSKCSVCDTVIKTQEVIPATGHTEVAVTGKSATCTESGLTDGSECSVCKNVINAQEVIPATGHTFGEWTIVKAPTTTEEGAEERVCSACSEKETRTIEKLTYIPGDVNSDGQITAADARIILRVSAKLDDAANYNVPFEAFDVTKDGIITAADARKVLRISAKLED